MRCAFKFVHKGDGVKDAEWYCRAEKVVEKGKQNGQRVGTTPLWREGIMFKAF